MSLFFYKVVKLIGGGSVINGAYPGFISNLIDLTKYFFLICVVVCIVNPAYLQNPVLIKKILISNLI